MALSLKDLMQHLLVLGGTGSGKTAGVLRPLCKQLGALNGVGLVVLDGKGALPGEVAKLVPDFTVIDPATKKMSLVEGLTPTEIVATVSDLLGRSEGKDRFFEESAAGLMRHAAVLAQSEGKGSWSLTGIWLIASQGPSKDTIEEADVTVPEVAAAGSQGSSRIVAKPMRIAGQKHQAVSTNPAATASSWEPFDEYRS